MDLNPEAESRGSSDEESESAVGADPAGFIRRLPTQVLRSAAVIAATLIGCQALAASSTSPSAVIGLLPDGLSGAKASFLSGFQLGQEEARACGVDPVAVDWQTLKSDQGAPLSTGPETALLVAPFAADLRGFSSLAQDQKLGVVLPYQRGESLASLVELDPEGRLHPVLSPLQDDLEQLASDALAQGWKRVMVVSDPSDRSADQAEDFVEMFQRLGGRVESFEDPLVQTVDPENSLALERLFQDLTWKGPDALVLAASPDSPLALQLADAQAKGALGVTPTGRAWVWMLPSHRVQDLPMRSWKQLVLEQPAHGPAWSGFQARFLAERGRNPDLLAASGYDTARMLTLASLAPSPVSVEGTRHPLGWLDPDQEPASLCDAVTARLRGDSVRLMGAASDLSQRPGQAPSGEASTRLMPGR